MIRGRLTVDGFKEITSDLGEEGTRARRPEAALRSSGMRREFEHAVGRRYSRRLTRNTTGWTIEKAKRGLDTRAMRATGDAEAALTRGTGPLASEVVFKADRSSISFGVRRGRSGLYYMNALARGYPTSHGRRRATRVVVIDKLLRENAATIVLRYVDSGKV